MLKRTSSYMKSWTIDERIEFAFEDGRVLRMLYSDEHGNKTVRSIHPIVHYTCGLGFDCVYAYCELRGELRTFRLDRMEDALLLYKFYDAHEYEEEAEEKMSIINDDEGYVITAVCDFVQCDCWLELNDIEEDTDDDDNEEWDVEESVIGDDYDVGEDIEDKDGSCGC